MTKPSIRAGVLALTVVSLLAPAALAGPVDDGARAFKYELRSVGAKMGEVVLSIGARTKIGDRFLRPVRLEARTEGLMGRIYQAAADATTWIDDSWLPVRAHWKGQTKTGKRVVDTKFEGKRITGEYAREGKPTKKTNRKLAQRTTDTVSVFAWLMNQDLTPGRKFTKPLFSGLKVYKLHIEVGEPERVMVPVGLRTAIPIHVTATRGKKFKREVTYWVGVDDQVPYKLSFKYGAIGAVDALLTGVKETGSSS